MTTRKLHINFCRIALFIIAVALAAPKAYSKEPGKVAEDSEISSEIKSYKVKVVASYPHNPASYTQGLFFHNDTLYESTGQYGRSAFYKLNLKNGKPYRKLKFARRYFAEGSVLLNGRIFILTWMEHKVFVLDAKTLEKTGEFYNPYQGWGLTTDGSYLYLTDGSATLYKLDPNTFRTISSIMVTASGKPVKYLNELEFINGRIWANVYTTDDIVIINPDNGMVEAKIDCTGLLDSKLRKPETDVLNGIAFNPNDGSIYLTGKNWPLLFKVELVD